MIDEQTLAETRLTRRALLKYAAATATVVPLSVFLTGCNDEEDAAAPVDEAEEPVEEVEEPLDEDEEDDELLEEEEEEEEGAVGAGETHIVDMTDDLEFVPNQLTINVGDTVTWRTVGAIPHTSTCDPEQANDPSHVQLPEGAETWDSGIVEQDEEFSHTFETPGEYTYFCVPHEAAGMIGQITVQEV